jgi:hypothetical protein
MKVSSWELIVTWEDGVECKANDFAPPSVVDAVEEFIDNWEEAENERSLVTLH